VMSPGLAAIHLTDSIVSRACPLGFPGRPAIWLVLPASRDDSVMMELLIRKACHTVPRADFCLEARKRLETYVFLSSLALPSFFGPQFTARDCDSSLGLVKYQEINRPTSLCLAKKRVLSVSRIIWLRYTLLLVISYLCLSARVNRAVAGGQQSVSASTGTCYVQVDAREGEIERGYMEFILLVSLNVCRDRSTQYGLKGLTWSQELPGVLTKLNCR
jgi:hypothetical protein